MRKRTVNPTGAELEQELNSVLACGAQDLSLFFIENEQQNPIGAELELGVCSRLKGRDHVPPLPQYSLAPRRKITREGFRF